MIVRIPMIAEIEVEEENCRLKAIGDARDQLDSFREATLPGPEYGVLLYEDVTAEITVTDKKE